MAPKALKGRTVKDQAQGRCRGRFKGLKTRAVGAQKAAYEGRAKRALQARQKRSSSQAAYGWKRASRASAVFVLASALRASQFVGMQSVVCTQQKAGWRMSCFAEGTYAPGPFGRRCTTAPRRHALATKLPAVASAIASLSARFARLQVFRASCHLVQRRQAFWHALRASPALDAKPRLYRACARRRADPIGQPEGRPSALPDWRGAGALARGRRASGWPKPRPPLRA